MRGAANVGWIDAVLAASLVVGVGSCKRLEETVEPPPGPAEVEPGPDITAELLDAVADDDNGRAGALLRGPDGATSSLRGLVSEWAATTDSVDRLAALERILAAVREMTFGQLRKLEARREALRRDLKQASVKLMLAIRQDHRALRCDRVENWQARAARISEVLAAAGPPAFDPGRCKQTEERVAAAAATADWAAAYRAWQAYAVLAGLAPASEAQGLATRSQEYARQMEEVLRELGVARAPAWDKVTAAPLVAATPISLGLNPRLARYAPDHCAAGREGGSAMAWPAYVATVAQRQWCQGLLTGEQAPGYAELLALAQESTKGISDATFERWSALPPQADDELQALMVAGRTIVSATIMGGVDRLVAKRDFVAAARETRRATQLLPTGGPGEELRRKVEARAHADILARIKRAATLKQLQAVWKDVGAYEDANGDDAALPAGERQHLTGALDAAGRAEVTRALDELVALNDRGVGYAVELRRKLAGLTGKLAHAQVQKLRKKKAFSDAEAVVERMLAVSPQDAALTTMLAELAGLARAERSERVVRAFKSGLDATAYTLMMYDPKLSTGDREALGAQFKDRVVGLKESAAVVIGFYPRDARAGQVVTAEGRAGRGVRVQLMPGAKEVRALFPVAYRLTTESLTVEPPQVVRTESLRSRYVASRRKVRNPEKDVCERQVEEAEEEVERARAGVQEAIRDRAECQRAADEASASSKGGYEGIAASIVGGAAKLSCNSQVETANRAVNARLELKSDRQSACREIASQIEEVIEETHHYEAQHVKASGAIAAKLEIYDLRSGQVLEQVPVAHDVQYSDRAVKAEPQYNVDGDPLEVPDERRITAELLEGARKRVERTYDAVPRQLLAAASAQALKFGPPVRAELLAELIVFAAENGHTVPPEWVAHVLTGGPAEAHHVKVLGQLRGRLRGNLDAEALVARKGSGKPFVGHDLGDPLATSAAGGTIGSARGTVAASPASGGASPACEACAARCDEFVLTCQSGVTADCQRFSACVCRCQLEAGGCGQTSARLTQCIETNEARAAAAPGK